MSIALQALGVVGWVWFTVLGVALIVVGANARALPDYWMLDWHVYFAGAHDLVERDLYRGEISVPGWALPTPVFNLPPASALIAVPFALVGREPGGVAWLVVGLVSLGAAVFLASRMTGWPLGWAWVGILLLAYTAYPGFPSHVLLGNNNHLVLLILTGFAWAHLSQRPVLAGTLLGLAISIKLWPIALLPLLVRGREWGSLATAAGVIFVMSSATLVWLGVDVVEPMLSAVRTAVPTDDKSPYIWTTWARENWSWWPIWLAPALGWILALVPVSGASGLGLGLLGGVMLVNNIWSHYLPTMLVGLALVAAGLRERYLQLRRERLERYRAKAERAGKAETP